MKMFRSAGTAPIERQFIASIAAGTVRLTYTYRNRADRQTADMVFFYIDLKDANGDVITTANQGQQTGLEFTETVDLVNPAGFDVDELFTISFRPYAAEADFYRIMLVSVSIELI